MSSEQVRERRSSSDQARDRAALRDVAPGLIAFLVVQGSLVLLNPQGDVTFWYAVWSFSPLAPALWLIWAQYRSLLRADERQRLVQLEAMAIGFGVMVVLSLTGGLLDAAGVGHPSQWLQVTFIAGVLSWLGALAIRMRAR